MDKTSNLVSFGSVIVDLGDVVDYEKTEMQSDIVLNFLFKSGRIKAHRLTEQMKDAAPAIEQKIYSCLGLTPPVKK